MAYFFVQNRKLSMTAETDGVMYSVSINTGDLIVDKKVWGVHFTDNTLHLSNVQASHNHKSLSLL